MNDFLYEQLVARKNKFFPWPKVEYEYILVNNYMQVDIIHNKSRRKSLLEFDVSAVEAAMPMDPQAIRCWQTEKTYDFTSGNSTENAYALKVSVNNQAACILMEPDEKMKSYINRSLNPQIRL